MLVTYGLDLGNAIIKFKSLFFGISDDFAVTGK